MSIKALTTRPLRLNNICSFENMQIVILRVKRPWRQVWIWQRVIMMVMASGLHVACKHWHNTMLSLSNCHQSCEGGYAKGQHTWMMRMYRPMPTHGSKHRSWEVSHQPTFNRVWTWTSCLIWMSCWRGPSAFTQPDWPFLDTKASWPTRWAEESHCNISWWELIPCKWVQDCCMVWTSFLESQMPGSQIW